MSKRPENTPAAESPVLVAPKGEKEKEQAQYYESFVKALKIVEERIEGERKRVLKDNPRASFYRHPYDRLREMKAWDAKWISIQYYLIAGRLSTLPKALRDFILEIGTVARAEYEAMQRKEAQESKENNKKTKKSINPKNDAKENEAQK